MKRNFACVVGLVVAASAVSVASDSTFVPGAQDQCFTSVAAYQAGLPAVENADALTAGERIIATTDNFSAAIKAVETTHNCYDAALTAANGAALEELSQGATETGRILNNVRNQFQAEIDTLTASAMADIAPAAGGDGDQIGQDATMEAVMNSMFVQEWAEKSVSRQAALEAKAHKQQ